LSIQTRRIDYEHGGAVFEGLLAWDDATSVPRPGVLVAHTIAGRSALEENKALALAALGYAGFAIDVYGKGTQTADMDANRDLMMALRNDRPLLQQRLVASLSTLRAQPEVDADKMAGIGFCFGGLCVLDIARLGEDVAGVGSFHGILSAPGNTDGNTISAKVLVLHGWDDPLATPEQIVAFADEMTTMGADWQLHAYGHTAHAFTNPNANDKEGGKAFSVSADRRSWRALQNFLAEIFS